jgi:hypothetical protein
MTDQSETAGPIGKIIAGDSGLGTVTPEMVDQRALELARMDGRTEAHEGDRDRAQQEFLGIDDGRAPEVSESEMENVTSWDEAPEATGVRAPQVRPENEATIGETLVQEGMEEAEHERRLSAAETNPPETE